MKRKSRPHNPSYIPHTPDTPHRCAVSGCSAPGEHKAPRSRSSLHEYQWLCLEHVREFNKAWDYFSGMSPDEIEAFRREAITGHRPTWKPSDMLHLPPTEALRESMARFFADYSTSAAKKHDPFAGMKPALRKALVTLNLEPPVTVAALKKHYKTLAKRYHPDTNSGDRAAEETFKHITHAYGIVLRHCQKHENDASL